MGLKSTLCCLVAAASITGAAVDSEAARKTPYDGIVQTHGVVESGYYVELWNGHESPLHTDLMVLTATEDEGKGCEIKFYDKGSDYTIDTLELKCPGWRYEETFSGKQMYDRIVILEAQKKFEKLMQELRKMGLEGKMKDKAIEILRR